MNPILEEIYSTVLPAAPFLIAAYALMWVVLLIYILIITTRLHSTEKQMAILEETLAHRQS